MERKLFLIVLATTWIIASTVTRNCHASASFSPAVIPDLHSDSLLSLGRSFSTGVMQHQSSFEAGNTICPKVNPIEDPPLLGIVGSSDSVFPNPMTWCAAGDQGRLAVPFTMWFPDWTNNITCRNFQCRSAKQIELFSPEASFTFAAALFAANESVIVIAPVAQINESLPFYDKYTSELFFGSPIVSFQLISASPAGSLLGLLVRLQFGGWVIATVRRLDSGTSRYHELVSIHPIYTNSSSDDRAHMFFDNQNKATLTYLRYGQPPAVSTLYFWTFQPNRPITWSSSLPITNVDKGPIELSAFTQMDVLGSTNRTLLLLYSTSRVHIIDPFAKNTSQPLVWTDNTAQSLFYMFSSGSSRLSIRQVTAFSEITLREAIQVPNVWLTIVFAKTELYWEHSINVTVLPEFAQPWKSLQYLSITNPAGLTAPSCGSDLYNNTLVNQCVPRPSRYVTNARDIEDPMTDKVVVRNQYLFGTEIPWFGNFPESATTFLFTYDSLWIHVFGIIPNDTIPNDPFAIHIEKMNDFTALGGISSISVTPNSLHLTATVFKDEWEISTMNRFADICAKIDQWSNLSPFEQGVLEPWRTPCLQQTARRPLSNDFIMYLSMCTYSIYCPHANEYVVGGLYPGYYFPHPIMFVPCPVGSFCPLGTKRACPVGFICPYNAMTIPKLCPMEDVMHGKSCYKEGLVRALPAPPGTIPVYPQAPPFPAPPGSYAEHDPNTGMIAPTLCASGSYCPLGRDESQNLLCPAGTFCSHPSVMLPQQCSYNITDNYCSYCPPGSTGDAPCRAGYYCSRPDQMILCQPPYYCPPGTMSASLCPAGFYCPTPSERYVCPSNHYCDLGTVAPKPCAILSICPAGTKNNSANFILALVFVVLTAGLVAIWKVLEIRTAKARAEKSRAVQEAEIIIQRSKLKKRQALNSAGLDCGSVEEYSLSSLTDEESGLLHINVSDTDAGELAAQIESDLYSKMVSVPFPVDISFNELGLKIKGTEKKVLEGVTGTIRHGRVTAVMGPSGAGKTTFMSTLANKAQYGDRIGSILLNGQLGDLTTIKNLVGFVPQDDVMLRELTVTEILTFNARIRLPASMSDEEKVAHVRKTIRWLDLYHIRHELIGDETKRGISGGQRKRVNIGMELVAQPTVLFLDEPTSGLDATSSLEVCGILRRVAEEAGLTVISVIHQPRYDIFTMFHDVLLLGKGGRTVYLGPTNKAVGYFQKLGFEVPPQCNPADFLIDVVSGSVPRNGYPDFVKEDLFQLWVDHAASNDASKELEVAEDDSNSVIPTNFKLQHKDSTEDFVLPEEGSRDTASFFVQLWYFFIRSLVQQKRNWVSILTDISLVVVSAVTFGIVFLDSHYIGPPSESVCQLLPVSLLVKRCLLPIDDPFPQIALMTTIGLALPAAMAALRVFGPERVVFWRESSVGAKTPAYYIGKELGFLPSTILLPLIYTAVFYNFTVPRMNFGLLYSIYLATFFAATGLALVVSILVPPNLATISTVVVVFGMSMFSGVRPTLTELSKMWPPFSYISYVSFFRWLTEAYYVSEIKQWSKLYNIVSGLDMLNYDLEHFGMCLGIVLGMGLAFRIIALICLEVMHRDQRK